MKNLLKIMFIGFLGFSCFYGCQKESEPIIKQSERFIPIFDLGDTLRNNDNISYEEIEIVIDTNSQYKFKLISHHNDNDSLRFATYFIKIKFEFEDNIKFLDSLARGGLVFKGPILNTFEIDDSINFNIANEEVFDWFPQKELQMGNTGWIKYQVYSAQQKNIIYNMKIGENLIVFKFGETDNERIGWFNIVYEDTICYFKEGYYKSEANEGIVVGDK